MKARLLIAAATAAIMYVLAQYVPGLFLPAVVIALVLAPAFHWRALLRLNSELRDAERNRLPGGEPIQSLRTATYSHLYWAIGAQVTATLGLFVAARELGIVEAIDRITFLMLISYPPIIAIGPALDWLATVGRMRRDR